MANHSLKAISPLGGDEARTDVIGSVTISEMIEYALASLTMRSNKAKPFEAAAKRLFKTALPGPGYSTTKGDFTLFWTSPEQWFVEAPIVSHEDIAPLLLKDFNDSASITEQSGGWCRFDIVGDDCISTLERLCAHDTATMKTDTATRTVIEHIGVYVLCRSSGNAFSIYGPRSSAGSLHHALLTAAKSALG